MASEVTDALAGLPLFAAATEAGRALAADQRARLARDLEGSGVLGLTQDEASVRLGIPRQTLTFRFRELEGDGLAVKTDRKRPTMFGRLAVVYVHRSQADG